MDRELADLLAVDGLDSLSDDLLPEQKLFIAIIESGFKAKDVKYLQSKEFEWHCCLLNLDSEKIIDLARKYSLVEGL